MKNILVYSLMKNSLVSIILMTIHFAKLMKVYKVFSRSLIDYGDIIYDQPHKSFFCEKLEPVQYKAALVITGVIQSTSHEKIFQELGLESLKSRRWFKRLCCMFKIMKNEASNYLISLIPKRKQTFNTRNKYLPLNYDANRNNM